MRKTALLCLLVLCATPLAAAESAHCDATPFTLGKPGTSVAKAQKPQPKAKAKAAQTRKARPKAQSKPRLLATCKDGKTKKPG